MASWGDLEKAEPEFAARARRLFDSGRHKTMATLRKDGSPRISGIEVEFRDGEMILGLMPGSVKDADLRRDPRLALHSPSPDPPEGTPSEWTGDAKIGGRAVELSEPVRPDPPAGWFKVEIDEVVVTSVGRPADHLVIESWHPDRGLQRRQRR
jgi:hypothetical protein